MSENSGQSSEGRKNPIGEIVGKISKKIRGKESITPVEIQVLDENDPQNVLSNKAVNFELFGGLLSLSVYSKEGFAEDSTKQTELAHFLIQKLSLKKRGPLLDVGFGTNIHISNTFSDEGIKAYAIDEQQDDHTKGESLWHAPREIRINEKGVNILSGDIADISSKESTLWDKKFGLILFNGSWTSGGNNWTVAGEVMEAKYHNRPDKTDSLVKFRNHEKDVILQSCKKHLMNKGLIGVISPRYAFHGAGYSYDQLSEEKLNVIDLFDRFQKLRAKKIYLFGVTQEGFDQMLERSVEQFKPQSDKTQKIQLVREQLRKISNLPQEDMYSKYGDSSEYQKSRIKAVIEATKNVSELNSLAKIDAIFAEF